MNAYGNAQVIGGNTEPFPYLIVEHLFDPGILAVAAEEFDLVLDREWQRFRNEREHKDAAPWSAAIPGGAVANIRERLGSAALRVWVEQMFGMPPLTADGLGGGFHSIPQGGHLAMHTDFNRLSNGLHRRINCLTFLNKVVEDDTGDLILGTEADGEVVSVPPVFGHTVFFETSDRSWHGHPRLWTGLFPRKSLAMYYYSEEAPADASPAHDTIFAS